MTEKKQEGFLGQKMVIIPKNIRNAMIKNPLINNLFFTDIGHFPNAQHHYRKRNEGATEYILIYCVKGYGWIEIQSDRQELVPNSYFIIPRNTAHEYGAHESNPWNIYWIHFRGNNARHFYDKFTSFENSTNKQPQVVQIPFDEERVRYFNEFINLLERGYSREIIENVNIRLSQLLTSFVYHDFISKMTKNISDVTSIVNTAINYMKENVDRSISVKEIADHLNYSNSYLYARFKEETGYSPIHYLNHIKIQKACQYLSFTNMSIKEISFELGYNDPFYFSRLFKKLMGFSPKEYRKKL